uniref:Uncharacterized protein n=1 Tax=Sus scrofa TaxID=9823 RepID=A0A4X1UWB0_PIG
CSFYPGTVYNLVLCWIFIFLFCQSFNLKSYLSLSSVEDQLKICGHKRDADVFELFLSQK